MTQIDGYMVFLVDRDEDGRAYAWSPTRYTVGPVPMGEAEQAAEVARREFNRYCEAVPVAASGSLYTPFPNLGR